MASLNLNNIQIGNNPTSSQNFIISQAADGTGKLARQSGGDIITWDAAGKVTFPLPPIQTQYSMVRVNTANGYGSTNTMIRRFTNIVTNVGSDITYADSATLGASFTINTNGIYSISYIVCSSGSSNNMGISVNSSQLTTSIASIAVGDRVALALSQAINVPFTISYAAYLAAGAIVRAHTDGVGSGSTPDQFTITRVS